MTSKLNKTDFLKRLEENTEIGELKERVSPFMKYTSFEKPEKILFGEFSETGFRLTKNNYRYKVPYIFEGKIISSNNESTELSLTVKIKWLTVLWSIIWFVLILIPPNFIFFTIGENNFTDILIISFNAIFVFVFLMKAFVIIKKKNKLLNTFYKTFEISKITP